jgi:hypothetical protein
MALLPGEEAQLFKEVMSANEACTERETYKTQTGSLEVISGVDGYDGTTLLDDIRCSKYYRRQSSNGRPSHESSHSP